eukprot:m.23251 g.23251  ORF g.23251 m.23251 type:complete len:427 (-) comp7478_c0_seq1:93-1373(-)
MASTGDVPEQTMDTSTSESIVNMSPEAKRVKRLRRRMSEGEEFPPQIFRIVVTGGPCAGKTSGMNRLQTYLEARGFRVFVVPEAATMMWSAGMSIDDILGDSVEAARRRKLFQVLLCNTQLHLEDMFYRFAEECARESGRESVLLCDRGCMDGSAYLSEAEWEEVLKEVGQTNVNLRDSRYDAVLHLVTAAKGARSHYTLDNNGTRTENPDFACELDEKTKNAWVGHPRFYLFENEGIDFETKLQKVVARVSLLVGLETSTQRSYRKYRLLSKPDESKFPDGVKVLQFHVEKIYLLGDEGSYHFIRKRCPVKAPNQEAFGLTTVTMQSDGSKVEQKRIIKKRDFEWLLQHERDTKRKIVRQRRLCCLWNSIFFEVHDYYEEDPAMLILVIQTNERGDKPVLPDFLEVGEDVTATPEASGYHVSKKG